MPVLALFDQGPFPPCPRPFNMAAHTFAAAERAPERVALEVLSAPGAVSARWTHAKLAEAVRRTAGVSEWSSKRVGLGERSTRKVSL